MPRTTDRESRRRELTEALWRITADRGLDAVSVREVATEAGVSIGTVQHYFATKDDLLLFAMEQMRERVIQRFTDRLGGALARMATPPVLPVLRQLLAEALPLDEERRTECRIWFAFLARAAVTPRLATVQRGISTEFQAAVAGLLDRGRAAGEIAAHVDPAGRAVELVALVDGLTAHGLVGLLDGDALRARIDDAVDRLRT